MPVSLEAYPSVDQSKGGSSFGNPLTQLKNISQAVKQTCLEEAGTGVYTVIIIWEGLGGLNFYFKTFDLHEKLSRTNTSVYFTVIVVKTNVLCS